VLSPRFDMGRIQKIELISLSEKRLLLVLSVSSGLVKTIIVEIEQEVPPSLLSATNELLNERLHELSIEELRDSIDERFLDVDQKIRIILKTIKGRAGHLFQAPDKFFLAGTMNVIAQPEFESREKIGKILELIDRKDILVRVLNEHQTSQGVSIVIGDENKEELMKNCSVITAAYDLQGTSGTLGVIGPTRMQYAKAIALVEFMSETLSHLISKQTIK
jgi:heat-inducible transcriptional repressor